MDFLYRAEDSLVLLERACAALAALVRVEYPSTRSLAVIAAVGGKCIPVGKSTLQSGLKVKRVARLGGVGSLRLVAVDRRHGMVLTKLSHPAKVIGGRRKPDVDERASLEGAALGDHRSRDPLPTGENVPTEQRPQCR